MLKRKLSKLYSGLLVIGFVLTVTTNEAQAYIDIATGSWILQGLLAFFFTFLFSIKIFWQRIIASFNRIQARVSKRKNRHTDIDQPPLIRLFP